MACDGSDPNCPVCKCAHLFTAYIHVSLRHTGSLLIEGRIYPLHMEVFKRLPLVCSSATLMSPLSRKQQNIDAAAPMLHSKPSVRLLICVSSCRHAGTGATAATRAAASAVRSAPAAARSDAATDATHKVRQSMWRCSTWLSQQKLLFHCCGVCGT